MQSLSVTNRRAVQFIVLVGVVSLLADMVYEGGRSLSGQYLALLGASGAVVGITAGVGELIGYGLRLVFGYLSDRTRRYWLMTILGYTLTVIAVPMLALANAWPLAVALLMAERFSKALRTPARDTLISYAADRVGSGKGFGLHEALDQVGAVIGPLMLAGVLATGGSFQLAFGILIVPGLLCLAVLLTARALFPQPADLAGNTPALTTTGFNRRFWLYLISVGLFAAASVDFALAAFHFQRTQLLPAAAIPALYALAMVVDAVAALGFGFLYDRIGLQTLIGVTALATFSTPLLFSGSLIAAVLGVMVWGIALGAQESILRAAVAQLAPAERRGAAYGLFNAGFGLSWFAGSAALGVLYDVSLPLLIGVAVSLNLAAVVVLWVMVRQPGAAVQR
ncbi:MFS transporter [Chloroflexus islandicus]|uniref:MFS transporter n=1 Tax=Chloroflexus islandicus TaxID=1707952 RepID=A0A178M843_9CHLR|nr:MFS transporter [Chloroflexus islandicus]OAN44929.1 MFS transporter [Chloroflexus islandicus]